MITSSFGIIMSARKIRNTSSLPANSILANAYAARIVTTSITPVVISVKRSVFSKYLPRLTAVNASM